ncbi:carbon storage regulator [Stieleria varia]|uniref:Translational regulator CsrA n=1 Tax=Stieleria varia TaxID=2528005 RepID=A0A5C6AJP7_9BACT|nr:carbon storage regulator [Stieleria varia]TWT98423.1 Carbon storage regulator [Stieleria varia]
MLVLSRKLDEKIMIGDDIVLTLVKIDSNRVRIGISAPKDVHILRGELAGKEIDGEVELEHSERQHAFAHPEDQTLKTAKTHRSKPTASPKSRLTSQPAASSEEPQLFTGTVRADGSQPKLTRHRVENAKRSAPLASFVAT